MDRDEGATSEGLREGEGSRSAPSQGRFARSLRAIFGLRAANRIADPRLEALRVYAVDHRTRGSRDDGENVIAAIAAGADTEALATARRMIDARASGPPPRTSKGIPIVGASAVLIVASWLFHALLEELGGTMPALVVTLLAATTLLPWALPRDRRRHGG